MKKLNISFLIFVAILGILVKNVEAKCKLYPYVGFARGDASGKKLCLGTEVTLGWTSKECNISFGDVGYSWTITGPAGTDIIPPGSSWTYPYLLTIPGTYCVTVDYWDDIVNPDHIVVGGEGRICFEVLDNTPPPIPIFTIPPITSCNEYGHLNMSIDNWDQSLSGFYQYLSYEWTASGPYNDLHFQSVGFGSENANITYYEKGTYTICLKATDHCGGSSTFCQSFVVGNVDDNNPCTKDSCDASTGTVLHISPTIMVTLSVTLTQPDCEDHICALVSGGCPNYTYSWSPSGYTDPPSCFQQTVFGNNPYAKGIKPNTVYTVTVTDGGGQTATATILTSPVIIHFTQPTTISSCDGIACVDADFGCGLPNNSYTYSWCNGTTTQSNTGLCIGDSCCVTITDGCGNSHTCCAKFKQDISVSVTVTEPTCWGGIATVSLGTNSPYSYSYAWSTGAITQFTFSLAGTISYTVSDGICPISYGTVVVTQPQQLISSYQMIPALCSNSNNGSIDLTVTGGTPPYNYLWNTTPVQTTSIATGMFVGSYNVITTDANGCSARVDSILVTSNNPVVSWDSVFNKNCIGESNGVISNYISYGTTPFSFLWSNGTTTSINQNLATGNYTLTVTDINGCSVSKSYAITESPIPTLGSYPNSTIVSGENTTVAPYNAPLNVQSAVANTNTNFTGTLVVDPLTGVVTITNAKQAGTYEIKVTAIGCEDTTVSFTLTVTNPSCSNGLFTNAIDALIAGQPYSVAIGDFNKDGNQDMAVSCPGQNSISIRMGDGVGNFTGSTNVQVGNNPRWVSVGDFNGDGMDDIAAANVNGNSVSVRLGNGSGAFTGSTELPVGVNPYCVAIGDFNGDGKSDLAAVNTDGNTVSIRLGNGSGGFSESTLVPAGGLPFAAAVGDFNYDGNQDLAVANGGGNSVSIRLGDGLGNFSGSLNVPVGSGCTNVQLGDFNNDGKQDLVATNQNSNNISILKGDGSGNFIVTSTLAAGFHPWSSAVGDFNGDGRQDITTANYGGNVSEWFGDGIGGFIAGTAVSVSNSPYSIAVGDFNNDSIQDLAIANFSSNTVSIRLGLGGAIGSEINVKGNSIDIADGDVTPDVTDETDFGNVSVGGNIIRTYTIQNTGTTDLTVSGISISGNDASLFTIGGLTFPSTLAANNSALFTVTFSPISTGVKTAAVHILNDDCNESDYNFAIQGNGGSGSTVTLIQNILLEGYYLGGGMMNSCLNITGFSADPLDADSIFVSAMNAASPYDEVDRQFGILKNNGDVTVTFGSAVTVNSSYYIKINHRNSIETWSANPILFNPITFYDFTNIQNNAFGNNTIELFDGKFAIRSGDISDGSLGRGHQDGIVESQDYSDMENAVYITLAGYEPEDITGDGIVESLDYSIMENNVSLIIFSIHP